MNKQEAKEILGEELSNFAARPYKDLVRSIGVTQEMEVATQTQARYKIEFEVFLNDEKKTLRIIGSISDGGLTSLFMPQTQEVIKNPDGSLA